MTPHERAKDMARAAAIELARDRTAQERGITGASLNTLAAFYAIQENGGKPRSKALVQTGLHKANAIGIHTTILRTAGLLEYAPGTNKGVRLTTAGKLVINAYSRELDRISGALLLV